ncbi:hypothetical protein Pcinc_027195, partial [Petrolisthes cinctipes]
ASVVGLLTPLIGNVSTALQGFIDIGKIGLGVAKFINIIFDQVFNASEIDMNFGSYIPMADRKILGMFELLSRRLDQMEHGVHGIANSLRDLASGMQNMVRWEIALDTLEEYARPINGMYKRFLLYQKMKDKVEDHTLMDFANAVVSHHPHSIMSLMAHIHSMAAPEAAQYANSPLNINSETFSILNDPKDVYSVPEKVTRKMVLQERLLASDQIGSSDNQRLSLRPSVFRMLQDALCDYCQLHQSPQQLLEGLYLLLALTEARGFAMLEFSWMLLRIYNEGNFTVEQEVSEQLYMQYSKDIMREAKGAIAESSRDFYRCDPRQHLEGETYVQLTELLQGYIENEVDMNEAGSCSQNCRYYEHAKSEGCYAPTTQYCGKHRRCRGTLHHCTFIDADANVCLSRKPYRRYEAIKYENGNTLGPNHKCDTSASMKVDSWWRFLYHCSYCFCLCDDSESPSTDRYFSLTPALSDTQRNMIVTGLKFTKQRRVIHLQIQEGQALPQGQVNTTSLHWVPVEPISIISTAYTEGTHYKKLSFVDRSIDLDRLDGPLEHVVTGVRFRMLGSHLNLELQITPVNFTTGELSPHRSYWISNDNTPNMEENPRQEIHLLSPDDPTKFPALSKIDSDPDTFVRFGPTDRGKDAAQLTVPFLDAQTVAPTPSSWLSGIELFHKGQGGSGGFLGFKVISYNATEHMHVEESTTTTVNLPNIPRA